MKKIHIIILLICLVLLFIVYLIHKKEGFNSDFSDFNTIDRIKTSDEKYAYCIAGNIVSPSGNKVLIEDDYKGGNTYNYLSNDYTLIECQGNFQYNMSKDQLNWKTPTAREISFPFSDEYKGFTIPYSYISTDISDNYINFYDENNNLLDNVNKCSMLENESETEKCISATNPTKLNSTVPIESEINSTVPIESEINSTVPIESVINSTVPIGSEINNLSGSEMNGGIGKQIASEVNSLFNNINVDSVNNVLKNIDFNIIFDKFLNKDIPKPKEITKDNSENPQKCIVDYGAHVGDPLCCGQTGVLQKSATEYICGKDAPKCSGYKCGTSFGTCS